MSSHAINPKLNAVRAGLARGWILFRQTFTNAQDLWNYAFMPVALTIALYFMRNATVPGTDFSLGAMALPSILGTFLAFGMMTAAFGLVIDRQDGTLLRAKATPNGMLGYLVGAIGAGIGMITVGMVLFLILGSLVIDGLATGGFGGWLAFAGIFVLGLIAVLPLGAAVGSLFSNPQSMAFIMLPMMGLIGISGIFYPITALPTIVQWIAQVFPVYWLGLGMRAALLPGDMVVAEIGESWRHLETIGVLGLWAIVGLVAAPILFRRMARRESGSAVEARKQKAMAQRM